jgi:hypothetical protein
MSHFHAHQKFRPELDEISTMHDLEKCMVNIKDWTGWIKQIKDECRKKRLYPGRVKTTTYEVHHIKIESSGQRGHSSLYFSIC